MQTQNTIEKSIVSLTIREILLFQDILHCERYNTRLQLCESDSGFGECLGFWQCPEYEQYIKAEITFMREGI